MKLHTRFSSILSPVFLIAFHAASAQYGPPPCVPIYGNSCTNSANTTWITNFKTTGGITNINNSSACSDASSYKYYQGVSCKYNAGSTVNWDATQSKPWSTGLAIYVDWNDDGIFTLTGGNVPGGTEKMTANATFFNNVTNPANTPAGRSFVVPEWAKQGIHRMRVRIQASGVNPTLPAVNGTPCGLINNGEAEDYDFEVVNPCTVPGVTSVSGVSDHEATVSWSARPNADMYEWLLDNSPADPASFGYYYTTKPSVSFPDVNYPQLQCHTQYYFHLRTICDTRPTPTSNWVYSPWTTETFTTDECCYMPAVTMSQIAPTSAVASWSAVPSNYAYEYALGTQPNTPPLTGGTVTNYTSVLLQGLPCNSKSYLYVRSLCSPTPQSGWTETPFFTLPCTSVDNITGIAGGVEAYPNPAKDIVTIKVNGWKNSDGHVIITDLSGKVLRTALISADRVNISLEDLATGIYLVKYADAARTEVIRINKQ